MSQYFTVAQAPLFINSTKSLKYCDVPPGGIVNFLGKISGDTIEVSYQTNIRNYTGFIEIDLVEPFKLTNGNVIKIRGGTLDQSDPAQYLVWRGNVQFNLCGPFSVLYCAGWRELTIEDWLESNVQPSLMNRLFYQGRSRTTGIPDLQKMLQTFAGYPEKFIELRDYFHLKRLGRTLFSPGRVARALEENRMIIGVTVKAPYGRLAGSGYPHWVVVEDILPEARGGTVTIYNSFPNAIESNYSWEEFCGSVKVPSGILVPR